MATQKALTRSCNPDVIKLTMKMGCLSANFSTPPLMMLQLKVMIPAYSREHVRHSNKSSARNLTISIAPQKDI